MILHRAGDDGACVWYDDCVGYENGYEKDFRSLRFHEAVCDVMSPPCNFVRAETLSGISKI